MARPSRIQLRKLNKKEQDFLRHKLKDKTISARIYERYRVIEIAQRGFSVLQISDRCSMHFTSIYGLIKRFNKTGFERFNDPPNPDGRPSSLSSKQIREMIKIALARPTDLGLPYTQWSVPNLSNEWIRRLLKREGVSLQHTKTWKESPDPDFEVKKTEF